MNANVVGSTSVSGSTPTPDLVLTLEPDAVVVATGARAGVDGESKWHPLPVPGSDQPFVVDHEHALVHADELGGRVVILDAVGHIEGVGLGELLAARGVDVTVVCPLPMPMLLDAETMAAALPRMARAGVRWRPNTALVSIGAHETTLIDTLSLRMETVVDVDTVVIRTHGAPIPASMTRCGTRWTMCCWSATRSPPARPTAPSSTGTAPAAAFDAGGGAAPRGL